MGGFDDISRSALAAVGAAVFVSGCGVMNLSTDRVSNPLTPAQSKSQVVDAARQVVEALNLHVVEAFFWRASCNDQGDPPFKGEARVAYPLAPSFEQSDSEVAQMAQRLEGLGWTSDSSFHSHGTVLQKNNVVVVFGPQNVSLPTRSIELHGECRDATTSKGAQGSPEPISFG